MPSTIFDFFGLRENPFKINPDPRFLFITEQARATADELTYAIRARKGLVLLTGEVGTGKTMMIRRLLDWLAGQSIPTALIFNSHINPDHLIDLILNDFGIPCPSGLKSEKLLALQHWLLDRHRAGVTPVLVVDEAQGLEPAALEEIRLLLNFETPREKLLQIVLAGQPELEVQLKRYELRQLRQRITIRCRTAPLTLEQTHGYVRERLRIAGADANSIFESDAIAAVHAYARGIPRVVNVLCEHSLINACAEGVAVVTPAIVEQAARDCQLDRADSVARILNTGSYSTTNLSDISSILNAVSASLAPDAPAIPKRPFPKCEEGSATQPVRKPVFQPTPTQVPSEVITPQPALAAAARYDAPSAFAPSREPAEPQHAEYSVEPHFENLAAAAKPARRTPPLQYFSHWYRSFAADVRSSWRQLRRAVASFESRSWKPFVRRVRREINRAGASASRALSDPRWKQLRARGIVGAQIAWHRGVAALPRGLSHFLDRWKTDEENPQGSVRASRPQRPRAIISLRRWLHEPLTTQRRSHRAHRRSAH